MLSELCCQLCRPALIYEAQLWLCRTSGLADKRLWGTLPWGNHTRAQMANVPLSLSHYPTSLETRPPETLALVIDTPWTFYKTWYVKCNAEQDMVISVYWTSAYETITLNTTLCRQGRHLFVSWWQMCGESTLGVRLPHDTSFSNMGGVAYGMIS